MNEKLLLPVLTTRTTMSAAIIPGTAPVAVVTVDDYCYDPPTTSSVSFGGGIATISSIASAMDATNSTITASAVTTNAPMVLGHDPRMMVGLHCYGAASPTSSHVAKPPPPPPSAMTTTPGMAMESAGGIMMVGGATAGNGEFTSEGCGTLKNIKRSTPNSPAQRQATNIKNKKHHRTEDSLCCCLSDSSIGDSESSSNIAESLWPIVLANCGVFALLLLYLLLGSFIFLAIEGDDIGFSSISTDSVPSAWPLSQPLSRRRTRTTRTTTKHYSALLPQQNVRAFHDAPNEATAMDPIILHRHRNITQSSVGISSRRRRTTTNLAENILSKWNTLDSRGTTAVRCGVSKRMHRVAGRQEVYTNGTISRGYIIQGRRRRRDIKSNNEILTNAHKRRQRREQRPPQAKKSNSNNEMLLLQEPHSSETMGILKVMWPDRAAYHANAHKNGSESINGKAKYGDNKDNSQATIINEEDDLERKRTVENIWDITVSLNILYKENWTKLAALEIAKFQDQLVKRYIMDLTFAGGSATTTTNDGQNRGQIKWNISPSGDNKQQGNQNLDGQQQFHAWQRQRQQQQLFWRRHRHHDQYRLQQEQQRESFEWNLATAFLYAMTVITTVGYGTITARTPAGRMATMVYATLGIPLTLIYLSSAGALCARLLRSLCARLICRCCSCCCICHAVFNRPGDRGMGAAAARHQVADRKCDLKLRQIQQQHQHQQRQLLSYCYVKPPTEAGIGVASSSTVDINTGANTTMGGSNSSRRTPQQRTTTTWSLALPGMVCILLLVGYIGFGAFVVRMLEDWPLLDAVYFCFMTLTTIGFCDLLPGVGIQPGALPMSFGFVDEEDGSSASESSSLASASWMSVTVVWFCSLYIISGLTLTAMCVSLLHDEIARRVGAVMRFPRASVATTSPRLEDGVTAKERGFYGAPP